MKYQVRIAVLELWKVTLGIDRFFHIATAFPISFMPSIVHVRV